MANETKAPRKIHYIAEWLERLGLQQSHVVEALGFNKGTVSKWCSGKLPSEDSLLALAQFLKVDPNVLFHHPDHLPEQVQETFTVETLLEVVEGSYHMLGLDNEEAAALLELVLEVAQEPKTPSAGLDFHRVQAEREVRRFLKAKQFPKDGA